MSFASLKAHVALPEIFLAGCACVILLLGVYTQKTNHRDAKLGWILGVVALLGTGLLAARQINAPTLLAFNDLFIADPMAALLKVCVCLLTAAAFAYGVRYNREREIFTCEYYVLGLFSVVGMLVMASSYHLLSVYLGLELMSLCLYAMIACARGQKLPAEAAMKYFVLGALASSILLYGMSLLYGLSGSLELGVLRETFGTASAQTPAFALSLVFVVVAIAFKLGAVPFHMWVPDVYHGAPTSTTAFISAAPKIAAFALVMRLLVGGLEGSFAQWQQMLIILALLSVGVGNLIAIAQTNLKRMLAYSGIAHMGFFLLGIVSGSSQGYSAALFYVIIYALMSLAGFAVIMRLATPHSEADQLDHLKGLSRRSPWLALLLLILMLSMAGIPPTLGFFAKLALIDALVQSGLVWVAVCAVILAVIGAFYYLRVIKLMYFDQPDQSAPLIPNWRTEKGAWCLLSANILALLLILPWVGSLLHLCLRVIAQLGTA